MTVFPAKLTVPGTFEIEAAPNCEGGAYYVAVEGNCLRLKRWFQYVPSAAAAR
jgi:hypothetical protein